MAEKNYFPEPDKKPNIAVPAGMNLEWNSKTGHWAFRPISGYSTVYLTKRSFIPKSTEERKAESKEFGKTKNSNFHKARKEKNDEFYTRLEDVADELKHYKKFFEGKVVYCPCDKAFNLGRSNFFQFLASHFVDWGLNKLVATQYVEGGHGWKWVIEKGDINGNGYIDESEIDTYQLEGDGDFQSHECRQIMSECDIVCTNPPFSLFRPFVGQIMELGKQFLIIGTIGMVTYEEIFPLVKEGKMWLGYTHPQHFETPLAKIEDESKQFEIDGKIFQTFGNTVWYTNLPHDKRKEELYLGGTYANHESEYPHYDNYDAIHVGRVVNIPADFDGIMGVPVSFLEKHNPDQFEIIGKLNHNRPQSYDYGKPTINGKETYARILIRRKTN